jgi:sugar phosphate isomerase/epimerase
MLYGAMNFPVRPILKELEAISKLNFDYLELTMDPPQAHYRMIREEKKNIIRALDHHKMKIMCHLPSFVSTADLTPRLREASLNEVLNSLDVAAELGCLKVVLHPSYLKLTLDIGHAHIGDKEGRRALDFIEMFPDRISHIHASDNFGQEDNHLPVGTGTVNFPEIIKALKEIGYDDTITLEVFSKDRDYLRISREKLAAMFATL